MSRAVVTAKTYVLRRKTTGEYFTGLGFGWGLSCAAHYELVGDAARACVMWGLMDVELLACEGLVVAGERVDPMRAR